MNAALTSIHSLISPQNEGFNYLIGGIPCSIPLVKINGYV